jgi:hypothetical protein
LSLEASKFLNKKGSYEKMEHYTMIRLYCSHEKPFYLTYYVSDRMFVIKVARQYKFWVHFFHQKRKKQFIPMPWKIGQILFRGSSKIDEFAVQLDQYNLKFADEIKGFDPNHFFMAHVTFVGYNISLAIAFLFEEEEGDNQDPPAWASWKEKRKISPPPPAWNNWRRAGWK